MVLPNIYGTNLILKDFKLSFIIIIKRIIEKTPVPKDQ